MSRMEKEHGRREDFLRQEISDLQQVRTLCHFKYLDLEIRCIQVPDVYINLGALLVHVLFLMVKKHRNR